MHGNDRRKEILMVLHNADAPVSAAALAQRFGVSRQIVVGDIAILRSSGEAITATHRGYVMEAPDQGVTCRIACCHTGAQMQEELNTIVDMGCSVLDVIVEHPIYGELTGPLQLKNRYDVEVFCSWAKETQALPLSALTEGIHLHTLSAPNEAALQRVKQRLAQQGFLISEEADES